MSDYTPTTNSVRARYVHQRNPANSPGAEFDRWLAEVKATAAAEALNTAADEAYRRGDIGKTPEGVEAWVWLRTRAAQALDRTP